MKYPIYDLHCDLLGYPAKAENGTPYDTDEIGAAIPHLRAGDVRFQAMALFTMNGQKTGLKCRFESTNSSRVFSLKWDF